MSKIYKVKDNQTGAIIDVPEEQLQEYGLTVPTQPTQPTFQGGQPAIQPTTGGQEYEALIQKYFPKDQWANAKAVMMAESGGNPSVPSSLNKQGTEDSWGLFQINLQAHPQMRDKVLDPEENVKYAAELFKNQGWTPWYNTAKKLGLLGGGTTIASAGPTGITATAEYGTQPTFNNGQPAIDTTVPKNITGHSLEEITATLNNAKRAGDTKAVKSLTDDYNRELEYQTKLSSGTFATPQQTGQKEAQIEIEKQKGLKEAGILSEAENKVKRERETVGAIINTQIDNYLQIPEGELGPYAGRLALTQARLGSKTGSKALAYEDARMGLAASVKAATGDTGILTDPDRIYLAGLFPKVTDNPDLARNRAILMDSFLKAKYGEGLDKETLEKFNIKEGEKPDPNSTAKIKKETDAQIKIGFGEDKSKDAFKYLEEAGNLAKQAVMEQDPEKKKTLLERSRVLSEVGSEMGQTKKIDPFTYGFGKAQEFLSESEVLPFVSAGLGKAIAPFPGFGFGIGAAIGEQGKQMLKTGGKEAFFPTFEQKQERTDEATKKFLEYGAFDLALWGAGKLLTPFKTIGDFRAAKIAEAEGKTINVPKVLSSLEEGVDEVSPTVRQGYLKFLQQTKDLWKDKATMTIDEAVKLNSAAQDAYTAAGKVGKAASAKFNDILGKAIREELKINAPAVSKANSLFKTAYGAKNLVTKYGPRAVLGALIYKYLNRQGK